MRYIFERYRESLGWTLSAFVVAWCGIFVAQLLPKSLEPLEYLSIALLLLTACFVIRVSAVYAKDGQVLRALLGLAGLILISWTFILLYVPFLFATAERRMKDTSHCEDTFVWVPGEVVKDYGVHRYADGSLTLKACVIDNGILSYSLDKDGKRIFETLAPGSPLGGPDPDDIASSVSVFHRWGMLWENEVLWVYTGDIGCFSLRLAKDHRYHMKLEDCERPKEGEPAKTVLGRVYLGTR